MNEDRFWSLIEEARMGGTSSASPESMTEILEPLTDDEVSDFGLIFYEKVCALNSWKLWGAGYVIAGGMSDDSFHYFRSWIVGKGQKAFETALSDPDEMGPFVDDPEVENELLEYVTIYLLKERGVGGDPRDRSQMSADFGPEGEPFDENTVASNYPKLAAQFC